MQATTKQQSLQAAFSKDIGKHIVSSEEFYKCLEKEPACDIYKIHPFTGQVIKLSGKEEYSKFGNEAFHHPILVLVSSECTKVLCVKNMIVFENGKVVLRETGAVINPESFM